MKQNPQSMSSKTKITTKHPARNPINNVVQKTISSTESIDKRSSGTPSNPGATSGGGPALKTPGASPGGPQYNSPHPSMIQGDRRKSPSRSPCTSDLKTGNKPSASDSSVNKHDGFNFAAVAFSPLVTKQTRSPRKKKNFRSMKQPPQEHASQKPNVTEANRPCGVHLQAVVGKPSTAKRRVTFKDELVNLAVAKNSTQTPKQTFLKEAHDNDSTESSSPPEGQVFKRNTDISRNADMSPTQNGKLRVDGEGALPTRDTSTTETAVGGRAGISEPLLTERLHQGKGIECQADDVTAEYCQDQTITHPERERNSLRDVQSQVCTEKNADQLTMTSGRPPHDRCGLRRGSEHPAVRICKVTPGEETIDTTHRSLVTSQNTSVAKTTDERRQQGECFPEDDDDRVLVIDETRWRASGDDEESVARRANAEDMVYRLGTVSSVDGTEGTPSAIQHQTTLAGEGVLPVELSQNDNVQDTNQTDAECRPQSYPSCNDPEGRPNNSSETKSREVRGTNDENQENPTSSNDEGAVLPSSSAVCFTKPSLVLCGGRSSSYSSPKSLATKTSQGSGGSFSHVPASTAADLSSNQTRLMAARLQQTCTAQSSPIRSTFIGTRCPPSQNTIQENLISEQSVETRRLLAPSYFQKSRVPEQSLQKNSFIDRVNQTSNHSSVPITKTTSPSVQILANTNLRGPHYMVLTREGATPKQRAHQAQLTQQQNPVQPHFFPPQASVFFRAPHASSGGPAQYRQLAVQSNHPGCRGSFGVTGHSTQQQRLQQSQPLNPRNPQVLRLKQPSVKTSSQLIRPTVFEAPAPPLRVMTPHAQTAPSPRSKEDLSLAGTCARCAHACTFSLVDHSNGGQCKGSIAYPNQTAPAVANTKIQPPQWTQQAGCSSNIKPQFPQRAVGLPPSLQGVPPPPPPQSQQLPHQVRIMKKHPSGTREPHLIQSGSQARVTPSSLIPNGTLFVQTPQGLVQIQQHGQMNRPQTGSLQQVSSATRKTIRESVGGRSNTFERQNRGGSLFEGQRPSAAAVATLTPASTVLMKSDELNGVRLPYPMPTQKQLLFLSSKTEAPNPPKTRTDAPLSNREVTAGLNSHTTKHKGSTRPLPDSKTVKNRSESHAEGGGKKSTHTTTNETTQKGVTIGSKGETKHPKTLAASETNEDEYNGKRKISYREGKLHDAASKTKSRIEAKASQLDDSEQQHSESVSGLPRSSYVKFLDSSVTVKCMYFPTAPESGCGVNRDGEEGGEESKDPSQTETLLGDKESDLATTDDCKDGGTSVNFSVKSAPLIKNKPELGDETRVRDVHSTEKQRRGDSTKSSVKYTEAGSDDDNVDETWHPGPRKSPSRYTRRFRNPRTGGLSKINIRASAATECSGHSPEGTLRSSTTGEDTGKGDFRTEPEIKSESKATCAKLNLGGVDSKQDVDIIDELGHPETGGISNNIFESKIDGDESLRCFSGSSFKAERKLEASPTKNTLRIKPRTPEKRPNSNSNKHEKHARKTVSDVTPGTPNVKTPTDVSNGNSPSKRPHQRSSQSRSSDSDNLSSKYPKKTSSKKGFHKPADKATSTPVGQPRASPRRLHDRHAKQSPAPLWQRVLKMLGLKKKLVRSPPYGATVWHKRRSSSVVLAESLAESARRLEKMKSEKSERKETFAEADDLPLKKRGIKKNRSSTEEKQHKEGDQSGSKKSFKKKKQTKTKKHHKRQKIVKTAKVSPESTTDPASGSLTSIDFDSRRQTRSRTRRERDSDSVSSSLADSASSASPSARRGRRTLASISAQTWEDCYRCTYLRWKETNESPENLTNDEGFKVMTNKLATPSRAGPSKDRKCFQKLLMSKWEDIVQTAHQTGTVEEKTEPEVGHDEDWPFETTSLSFVETPPVASELSVCTTDCFGDASTLSQQEDWNVYSDEVTDNVVSSEVDIKSEELSDDDDGAVAPALLGSSKKNVIESYGYPPALSPIRDYSEIQDAQNIKHPSQATPPFFIPQTLTEETLQLLAESGSIDSDLNGLQAFALFMPESGGTDPYGDPSSTSPPHQPVSDGEGGDVPPPVISCHRLHTDDVTHGDRILDVEEVEDNTNQSQSNLFYIPVPSTDETDSEECGDELLELSSDAHHPRATDADGRGNSFHDQDAETENNHGNEEEGDSPEPLILRKMDSSLEEGEIIDETEFSDCQTLTNASLWNCRRV